MEPNKLGRAGRFQSKSGAGGGPKSSKLMQKLGGQRGN